MMLVMVAQLRAVLDDASAGTVTIGPRKVRRLGFGAMRVSRVQNAEGVPDRGMAVELVLGARDRGVQFFDTANIYGMGASEEILAAALAPYAEDVLVATKAGFRPGTLKPGQRSLPPLGRPEHIREECDRSLRRLRVDSIDLYQVHVPDPEVPWAETVGAFAELQQAGKVRAVGVSNVTLEQLREAQAIVEVVSVQNRYSVGDRRSERVLGACEEDGIAFLPWAPLLGVEGRPVAEVVDDIAASRRVHKQQVALAWLLQRSPVILPIPGTSQLRHADENVDAAWLRLSDEELAWLDIARPATATGH
jgi:aryl-alcohol dehydrogenase-like predicted oxidoreductase